MWEKYFTISQQYKHCPRILLVIKGAKLIPVALKGFTNIQIPWLSALDAWCFCLVNSLRLVHLCAVLMAGSKLTERLFSLFSYTKDVRNPDLSILEMSERCLFIIYFSARTAGHIKHRAPFYKVAVWSCHGMLLL